MEILPLITQIPKDSKILLIDVQMSFIEQTNYFESEKVSKRVDIALDRMRQKLIQLKAYDHEITAVCNGEDLHPVVDGLQDKLIEAWEFYDEDNEMRLNPEITENYSKDDFIVVCGLWREMCVMAVTVLLHKLGYRAAMLLDDDLTLRSSIGWDDNDNVDLLDHCISHNISIISLDNKGDN